MGAISGNEKKGLGRGLGALLGEDAVRERPAGSVSLRIAEIEPNIEQPRKRFDDEALADLAESIRIHGVLTPLLVRKLTSGSYQIIAGERRWRAARMAGLTHLPVTVIEADDRHATELALIENLQREDLNPIEEAEGYRVLMDEYGMTQEDVSQRVGRSRSAVANVIRLLSLPPTIQAHVADGNLSEGHARAVLSLPEKLQEKAVSQILDGGLSVRQTETLAKKWSEEHKEDAKRLTINFLEEHEQNLSRVLKRKVRIISGKQKGRIELEFYGADDLEELIGHLSR